MRGTFFHKDLFLDREAIQKEIVRAGQSPDRAKHAGMLVRSEARRSMTFTKRKPAAPGRPPHWRHNEPNLRSIEAFWSRVLKMVAIGSPVFPGHRNQGQNVPEVHNFGGLIKQPTKLRIHRPKRFRTGRKASRKQAAALNRKMQQPQEQDRMRDELRQQPVVMVTKRYPARPYMWPALLRTLSKLPRIWKGAITRFDIRPSMANAGGTTYTHGGAVYSRAG